MTLFREKNNVSVLLHNLYFEMFSTPPIKPGTFSWQMFSKCSDDICLFRAGGEGCAIRVGRDLTVIKEAEKFWLPSKRLRPHGERFAHFNMQTYVFISVFPLK